eukprot:3810487-Prymnesium_polylepis.1
MAAGARVWAAAGARRRGGAHLSAVAFASSTKMDESMAKSIFPVTPTSLPLAYCLRAASSFLSSSACSRSCFAVNHACNRSNVTGVRVVSSFRRASISSCAARHTQRPVVRNLQRRGAF